MNVLCLSHLYPNKYRPNYGVFVKERLKAVSMRINCDIVAPVPFFPCANLIDKYKNSNKIPEYEIFDELPVSHPKYFFVPKYLKSYDGYFYYRSINNFISSLIEKSSVDLIDVHWLYPDAYAAIKWAKKFDLKIIVTIRGYESIYYHSGKKNFSIKKKIHQILKFADHIISVSTNLKNIITNEYAINPDNISVITNGIDPTKFITINKNEALRFCDLSKRKKNILSVSRLSSEKGLDTLIKAIAILKTDKIHLSLIGDGPMENNLKKLSRKLGVSHQITFVGDINHAEIYYWYNAADIFCLSSRWEGCPNVIIEALACGTPVVSARVGAVPDIVKTEEFGMLVPPDNPKKLAVVLDKALHKDWDRKFISTVGLSNTWDHVAGKVVNVFESVLD